MTTKVKWRPKGHRYIFIPDNILDNSLMEDLLKVISKNKEQELQKFLTELLQ